MSEQHKDPLSGDFDEDFFKELDEIQLHSEPVSTQQAPQNPQPSAIDEFLEPQPPQNPQEITPSPTPKAKKSLFDFGKTAKPSSSAKASKQDPAAAKPPKAPKPKSGFFGSKPTAQQKAVPQEAGTLSKKSKANNPNTLILLALLAIGVAIGAWFLLKPEATPEVDTQAIAPAVEAPVATPSEPTDTQMTAEQSTDTAPSESAAMSEPTAAELPQAPLVDAEKIVNAQIPESPELIKEEIDLLKDKDSQLSEQAKLINEQLKDLENLTQAKQEQIALLEKQIALLEEQKGK